MKILIVCRYKSYFPSHIMPFITEQAEAMATNCNCEVEYFTVKGKGLLSYFTQIKSLRKKISEFKPDIIHAHYGLSGITAVLQNKVPVVTTFHNGETLGFSQNLLSSIFSLKAKHVIYVAQHIYDKTYFKRKNRYTILPCGVNLDECVIIPFEEARKMLDFEKSKKYIIFGGGFDNLRKNFPLLNEALVLLTGKQGVPKQRKVNVKDGEFTLSSYDYGDIEVFEMKNMSRQQCVLLMCACDLFALPSKSEGSPQALKEAMACNCPILATDIADIKHLLGNIDGHYICTFEPQNVTNVLKESFSYNGRTKGRERIAELGYDNVSIAKKIEKIYNLILEE